MLAPVQHLPPEWLHRISVVQYHRMIAAGVFELRIDYGPGYRVYFTRRGHRVVILLAGGSKRSQAADIKTALRLARAL